MRNTIFLGLGLLIICGAGCNRNNNTHVDTEADQRKRDSLEQVRFEEEKEKNRRREAADIELSKELQFDPHTLEDTYPYKDTLREFQFEKIKEKLAYIENFHLEEHRYAVLQNYKNRNGEAKTVKNFVRNAYKRVSDTLGTERYQSVPLYQEGETNSPAIYGRDGSLVSLVSSDTLDMVRIEGISFEGTWDVPKRYVKILGDTARFHKVVFVDVTNQNILTAERKEFCQWTIRSMNPATTGQHRPPYAQETPIGIFVVQEQKAKMFYTKDGSTQIEGFAPWASRFTNGAYTHGVPVNNPKGKIIEHSWSLGTTPRSHMCVRNASSHAKFIYDMVKPYQSLVVVID